ncbi:MAG: cation:proton antiporter [Patescibacteria group bacterium]
MPNLTLAFDLLLVLSLAFFGGLLAKKLRQPLILGYVLSGVTIGSLAVSAIKGKAELETLSEIGVALLLFSLGIEFSFARLTKVREVAFWGGLIQILTCIFLGILIFPRFGFDFYSSLFLASCFSLSSTAVVTKILFEKGELDSLSGEIMVGWLLIQDLAVLPMLLILPKIAVLESISFWQIPLVIIKVGLLLFLVLILGRLIVPKILDRVAETNSREILLLSVVALCLTSAFGTYALGLSFALGAFLAGLIISESSQNHAIFSEIRPLRDIFAIVFFVTLGMMLAPSFLFSHLGQIILLSLVVIGIKLLVVAALVLYLGYHSKTAFLVGVGLVQVGEFSFVLSRVGISQGLITSEIYSYVLSVALLTIILTPFFFNFGPKIYARARKLTSVRFPKIYSLVFAQFDRREVLEELPLEGHVVICGYGRVGSWLGRACQIAEIPFIVIDFNHQVVSELKEKGIPVVYGDPADLDVLDYAQVDKARVIVIAIPDRHTQELVIGNSLTLNPKINIICRSHFEEDQKRLKALGVKNIIMPEFEASLSIIHRILQDFGISKEEVSGKIKRIKLEHGM